MHYEWKYKHHNNNSFHSIFEMGERFVTDLYRVTIEIA